MTEDIRLTIYFNTQEEKEFCQKVIRNKKENFKLKKTGDALVSIINDYIAMPEDY